MRRPDTIVYWQNEAPPARIAVVLALQQVAFLGALLVIPSVFAHQHEIEHEAFLNIVSATLMCSAVSLLLQVMNRWQIGSGYYYPMQVTSATLPAMYLASQSAGGLAASYGMVVVIAATQFLFSLLIPRLRSVFTVEVAGLAVLLVGVALAELGLHLIFEGQRGADTEPKAFLLAGITFFTMVACNVWSKSALRLFATLAGLAVGALAGWQLGLLDPQEQAQLASVPWFRLPALPSYGWQFEPGAILPYSVTGLFLSLASMGTQTIAQQVADADWVRPDLPAYGRGLRAESLTHLLVALLNAAPLSSSGGGVTQAAASGSTSRYLAYWVAGAFLLFAFLPKLIFVWLLLPDAVMGGLLLFLSAFTMLSGMQLIGSRLLDNRRVLAVGTGLAFALSFPALQAGLGQLWPSVTTQVLFSGFAGGMLAALVLTALFRIGMKRRAQRVFRIGDVHPEDIAAFMEHQGRLWGARRDVVQRAELTCWQAFDLLVQGGLVQAEPGEVVLETRFDDYSLAVSFRYRGTLPALTDAPPTAEELIDDPAAQPRLTGYLIGRLGRARTRMTGQWCVLQLAFAA